MDQKLKSKLTLPPMMQERSRDRNRGERDRNRIRLEIQPKMATVLVGLLNGKLSGMIIDDEDFTSTLHIYNLLKAQLKIKEKNAS